MGEIAGAAGCWATGVETKGESGNYSLFFHSLLLFKEKQLTLCLPPSHISENIPFPSTFPSPNLKPTLHSPPQQHHPSPPPSILHLLLSIRPCLESQALSLLAIYIT